jgi:hypothetical protein
MKLATLILCAVGLIHIEAAKAKTLTFQWSGSEAVSGIAGTAVGTMTFPDGLTTVRMTDLTSFTLTEIEDQTNCGLCRGANPDGPLTSTYKLDLSNLTEFSLTLVNGVPQDFTLQTNSLGVPGFRVFQFDGSTLGGFYNAVGLVTFKP